MERPVAKYLNRILGDARVKVWHVGTYLALVLLWDKNKQSSPFRVTRRTIMQMSRARSKTTHHKCLKELENLGYIKYLPSYHPGVASKVWLIES